MTATTTNNGRADHDNDEQHDDDEQHGRIPPHDDDDQGDEDEFDNPALDDDQPGPTSKRTRSTRLVVAVLVAAAVAVTAARALHWGPFSDDSTASVDTADSPPAQFVLPQEVIDAINLAHTPGSPVAFSNRPTARDLSACNSYPPLTNEALYGMGGGDAAALCERALENGAPPCDLYIGVATTEKGAIFFLSTDGSPLPGQKSVPAKMYYCDAWDPAAGTTNPLTVVSPPVTGGQ